MIKIIIITDDILIFILSGMLTNVSAYSNDKPNKTAENGKT